MTTKPDETGVDAKALEEALDFRFDDNQRHLEAIKNYYGMNEYKPNPHDGVIYAAAKAYLATLQPSEARQTVGESEFDADAYHEELDQWFVRRNKSEPKPWEVCRHTSPTLVSPEVVSSFYTAEEAHQACEEESRKAAVRIALAPAKEGDGWRIPEGYALVPIEPTVSMLNAAIDAHGIKLGCIAPLGFRISPQQMFEQSYKAMLTAAPPAADRNAATMDEGVE